MKTSRLSKRQSNGGSIVAYFIFLVLIVTAISSVGTYVVQTHSLSQRRTQFVDAQQLAEGGAAAAAAEFQISFTNAAASSVGNALLTRASGPYTLNSSLSSAGTQVYQRTITSPFVGQSVAVQIWLPNASAPTTARVVGTATVGKVTRTAVVNLHMKFAFGAAIISDDPGSTSTSVSKSAAQAGNVVVDGNNTSTTIVDGNTGRAVLANGRVNVDTLFASVPASAVSSTNYGTENQIPDYTAEGSPDQLFDFNRFIAVAKASGTHYTNLAKFIAAAVPGTNLQGVIVVNVKKSELGTGLDAGDLPNGINVIGTLVFNFASDVGPSDKLVNTAALNINKANLTGLVPTNPSTYTTGYPPVFTDPTKNPFIVTPSGYSPFAATDDLPALMFNVGILDLHGPVNVCGVVYSPSFMEIENKKSGQTQYFNGSLIGGGGILVENKSKGATSIVRYDPAALDFLATSHAKGKRVSPAYWE